MPTIKTAFKLDGEREYKAALSQIGDSMRVLNSEMKKVSSAYTDNADKVEKLSATNDVLERKILTQKDKIEYLKNALQDAAEKYGEADKRTMQWQTSLNNAEAELNKMSNELSENEKQMNSSEKSTWTLGDAVNGLTQKLGVELPEGMQTSLDKMLSLDAGSVAIIGTFAALVKAIVAVEKALVKMTNEQADAAKELETLSAVTGLSTQTLQEYQYAEELTGVSTDTLRDALKEITNKMEEARSGSGEAAEYFDRLGVSTTDASGNMRDAETALNETISALGNMESETERNAVAMKLMGESAQNMNPLIEMGSDAMQELAEEAEATGYVLDDVAQEKLVAVADAEERMRLQTEAVQKQLSSEFAPYLEEFYGDATSAIKTLGTAIKDSGIVDAFGMLLETTGDLIDPMGTMSDSAVPKLTNALEPLADILALIADAMDAISSLSTLDFKGFAEALGFGDLWGSPNNYQTLKLNRQAASEGWSEGELEQAYQAAINSGDSSTIGVSDDTWKANYKATHTKKYTDYSKYSHAAGTDNFAGGLTQINENGPERIYLPSGSRIQSASETRYTDGGDTYKVTVYVDHIEDLQTLLKIAKNQRMSARMEAK